MTMIDALIIVGMIWGAVILCVLGFWLGQKSVDWF